MKNTIKSETAAEYRSSSAQETAQEIDENEIIESALKILAGRMNQSTDVFTSPDLVKKFVVLNLSSAEREHFCCLFLDNRHRLIKFETLFSGTVNGASVHVREVLKRALELNASALIIVHNHPSGDYSPSQADKDITKRLTDALSLVDVRVLDHLVVGGVNVLSFAEAGLI